MAGVADATGLPVDAVAVPEGAAYGAAFLARLAAGLEPSIDESRRWARTGRRVGAGPGMGEGGCRAVPAVRGARTGHLSAGPRGSGSALGSKATLMAPLSSGSARRAHGPPPVLEGEAVGQHRGDVDPAVRDEVEVVGDGVLAHAVELLDRRRRWTR